MHIIPSKPTARELLASVWPGHAWHTVVAKMSNRDVSTIVDCSCGDKLAICHLPERPWTVIRQALRNVPEAAV